MIFVSFPLQLLWGYQTMSVWSSAGNCYQSVLVLIIILVLLVTTSGTHSGIVTLTFCHRDTLSHRHTVTETRCHRYILWQCISVTKTLCHRDTLSQRHTVTGTLCHRDTLSQIHTVTLDRDTLPLSTFPLQGLCHKLYSDRKNCDIVSRVGLVTIIWGEGRVSYLSHYSAGGGTEITMRRGTFWWYIKQAGTATGPSSGQAWICFNAQPN